MSFPRCLKIQEQGTHQRIRELTRNGAPSQGTLQTPTWQFWASALHSNPLFFIFIFIFHIQSLRLRLTSTFSPCHVTPVISQPRPSEDSPSIASSVYMNLRVFARICVYLLVFASTRIYTFFICLCAHMFVTACI